MAQAFSTGTLTFSTGGDVDFLMGVDISFDASEIPAPGNTDYPTSVATGQKSVKGTAKAGEFSDALLALIGHTATPMAPNATETTLTWTVGLVGGTSRVMTFHNVTITSFKVSGASDKWITSDISFSCGARASDGRVWTIAS